jgi:hypothetical protein
MDLELLRRQRWKGTVLNWEDRRKDLYTIRYAGEQAQHEV